MQESIIIRNFGPIKEVELSDIKPLTVLIGPSGCGKSTVIKVLALFRWLYKMQNIRSYLNHSGMKKSPFRFTFHSYERNSGWQGYLSRDTKVEYQRGETVIKYENKKLSVNGLVPANKLHLEKVSFIADNRIVITSILTGKTKTEDFYLSQTLDDFRTAMEYLREYEVSYLDISLTRSKGTNGIEYKVSPLSTGNRAYNIGIDATSSGTQSMLPIGAIARYYASKYELVKAFNEAVFRYVSVADRMGDFKPVTNIGNIASRRVSLHIEEPELSLSPDKQIALINELVATCFSARETSPNYEMGIILTTHSPYIVNQLNLLMLANEKSQPVDKAMIGYDQLGVYRISTDGKLYNLKSLDAETPVIDTMSLSDDINSIYDRYEELLK